MTHWFSFNYLKPGRAPARDPAAKGRREGPECACAALTLAGTRRSGRNLARLHQLSRGRGACRRRVQLRRVQGRAALGETQGGPVRPPPPRAPHTNFTPTRTCPPLQGQTSSPPHESLKAKRFHSFSGRNHLQEGTSPGFNNILLEARSYFRALLW